MRQFLLSLTLISILGYGIHALAGPSNPPSDDEQTACLYLWDKCHDYCKATYAPTDPMILYCLDYCDYEFEQCYL
ncbi:MAG: hypothetical protein QNK37_31380 [Acidobacteriota bacterium]|nr:hypothetical protein [Acidobacteriota bacterium]